MTSAVNTSSLRLPCIALVLLAVSCDSSVPLQLPGAASVAGQQSEGSVEPLAPTCPAPEDSPASLRFGATPYAGPDVLKEQFGPVVGYLGESLGRTVELVSADSYSDLLDRLERGEVDFVSLSPLSYVLARERMPCLQLMLTQVTNGSTYYSSHIVVRQDSHFDSLDDLRGKRFAFVSRDSTSGYLFPRAYLVERGVDPDNYFSQVVFGVNHIRTIRMLLNGQVDAAATFSNVFSPARSEGVDVGSLRVLAITGRIPYDAVCARPGLDRALVQRAARSLYDLNSTTEEGRKHLRKVVVDINGWIYTQDSEYDSVRVNRKLTQPAEAAR